MSNLSQFSLDEVHRSSLISQFAAAHDLSLKKSLSSSELRQLQSELGRISAKAATRVTKLERNLAAIRSTNSTAEYGSAGTNDAWKQQEAPTPNTDHPASKRIKSKQSLTRQAGSDSENSTRASSVPGSNRLSNTKEDSIVGNRLNGDTGISQTSSNDTVAVSGSGTPKAKHSVGTPVQDDFSRVKVTNQVPIQTFWASLEPYFRNITDEDLAFLENTSEDQETFVIPKLGKFYAYKWAEEEVAHFPDHMHNSKTRYMAKSLLGSGTSSKSRMNSSAAGDSLAMSLDTTQLAPLTERIISALVAERLILNEGKAQSEAGDSNYDAFGIDYSVKEEEEIELRQRMLNGGIASFEERLKRELQYIGILDDDDVDWDNRQDDEVCVTIRALQRQLREQKKINSMRKARLLPIAKEHIGYQEYTQVIDELDKQVEQCYIKRHRQTKSRKRKSAPVKTVSLSDNAVNALERRSRVIDAIGHLFPPEKFALPTESIYSGIPKNPDIQMK
ncbi:Transcriptional regulator [Coemansia sp. RSA 1290]|nr:Transcriptional regulator [Coemansia sp. RSA 1086]KAJ1748197.1 Transcriptional regulator [Coemansia sp. RSA 1821]KAJ1870141.1 Transcriptional regulator [Coemansia sp. RSA 990]KAJ2632149.1 Transcriptional regulator [Coemansia sp. RSA 1290]KAJ2646262.1 Transcriptional regulator [Coemansia sp. RSA 1250]KAJ2670122.1 Transcriptional regulator [Coemansia sp. RSA 1085]